MSWIDRYVLGRKARAGKVEPKAFEDSQYIWRPAPAKPAAAADSGPPAFPRFQSTAGDQLDPRRADRFALIRAKLRNAYTPAQPVTDRAMFAGRTKVLTALIRSIEDQRLHTIIYGERGIGKTSLLQMLAQAAHDARYLVIYVTCGAGSEFDETFRAIAGGIPLIYHEAYGPTSPEGERGDTLAGILTAEPISVRYACDVLSKIEGTRVLVILDEYDRATSEIFRRNIAELLKSLSDQAVRVQVMIAGVAANLTELVANIPSIQRNIFALQVPKMSADEIRSVVKNGEIASSLTFEEEAIQAVISRCMGFPYLASLISHRSALVAIDQSRLTITSEDVVTATSEAVEEFRDRISRRAQLQIAEMISRGLLKALGALASAAQNGGGWFTLDELALAQADDKAIADAKVATERLAGQRVLLERREDEFGHAYRFIEPSVAVYVWLLAAKNRSVEQERASVFSEAV